MSTPKDGEGSRPSTTEPSPTPKLVLHPENEIPLETHEDFVGAITWVEERLSPLYRVRANLREELAARFPPPELPAPRYRTQTQEKVARCPRCGGRLESEGAPSK